MVDYFVLIVVYFKFVFFLCVENWENEILRYYKDLSCRGILNLVMSISINFFFWKFDRVWFFVWFWCVLWDMFGCYFYLFYIEIWNLIENINWVGNFIFFLSNFSFVEKNLVLY